MSGKKPKTGVIGLGAMGATLAARLISLGYEVHLYNRTASKAEALLQRGAILHSTPRELGGAVDVAITSLTDHLAVQSVALGEEGLLNGMTSGCLWIDMSTIDPDASIMHAQECERRGIDRLDVPISGSPDLVAQGKVLLLVGGNEETFHKYEQFLEDLGGSVIYLGPDGSGHKMKLVVNVYMGIIGVAFAEALVLSLKLGFAPGTFVDTVNITPHKNAYSAIRGPKIAAGDFSTLFSLSNLMKDLNLAEEQAKERGVVMPVSALASQMYRAAVDRGLGGKDFSAVTLVIQTLNGSPGPG